MTTLHGFPKLKPPGGVWLDRLYLLANILVWALVAVVLLVLLVPSVAHVSTFIYEVMRVPDYYVCEPTWPFDCQPGF